MITDTPIKTPNDVTEEMVQHVQTCLIMTGVAHLTLDENGKGNVRRLVLATMPESEEIMVAMEGSGCIFLRRDSNLNPFIFVTDGFQLTAAQIVTKLFVGLASARADLEAHIERAYPQLTHQNRS